MVKLTAEGKGVKLWKDASRNARIFFWEAVDTIVDPISSGTPQHENNLSKKTQNKSLENMLQSPMPIPPLGTSSESHPRNGCIAFYENLYTCKPARIEQYITIPLSKPAVFISFNYDFFPVFSAHRNLSPTTDRVHHVLGNGTAHDMQLLDGHLPRLAYWENSRSHSWLTLETNKTCVISETWSVSCLLRAEYIIYYNWKKLWCNFLDLDLDFL